MTIGVTGVCEDAGDANSVLDLVDLSIYSILPMTRFTKGAPAMATRPATPT